MGNGFDALYVELWGASDAAKRKTEAARKTRYTCESCGLNAWAKPGVALICGASEELLETED